jgi:CRISPR system Cascade subunit CasE
MLYVSRLILNLRSRQVLAELRKPYEMHRTLLKAFPTPLPSDERVLFRVDEHPRTGQFHLLVQSHSKPDWGHLERSEYLASDVDDVNPAVKEWEPQVSTGQLLSFRLTANPTKRLGAKADPTRGTGDGKRVPILELDKQLCWLKHKGEQHGFRLLDANVANNGFQTGAISRKDSQEDPRTAKWLSVRFDGHLQVTDSEKFAAAVAAGIGTAKAFGFGLLSVASPR